MFTDFITKVIPRISSSTRIVLLGMILALIRMSLVGTEIPESFQDVLIIIVGFFFGQRAGELVEFSKKK